MLSLLATAMGVIVPAVAVAALRMGDVTLSVFRTMFIVQEKRLLASLAAAAESATWLAAAGIVFDDMSIERAIGFVIGVGLGTAFGLELSRKMKMGWVTVRIYAPAERDDVPDAGPDILRAIHSSSFGATTFRGVGVNGPVDMILSTVRRKQSGAVVDLAKGVDDSVFVSVDNYPVLRDINASISRV